MTPQEIVTLCHELGLTLHEDDGHLRISPAQRLPASLRQELHDQKADVLALLSPPLLERPRVVLRRLEKAARQLQSGTVDYFAILHGKSHNHSEAELSAYVSRHYSLGEVPVLHLFADKCEVCQEQKEVTTVASVGNHGVE